PWYSWRRMSSLTKYDLPAPERASTTLLWFSWAHRSHHTMPWESGFTPYSTPPVVAGSPGNGAARSADANGNAAADAWVSVVRRIRRPWVATGRVVGHPARCRQVAGCSSSRVDAAAAFACPHASTSSASVRACTVRYSPTENNF